MTDEEQNIKDIEALFRDKVFQERFPGKLFLDKFIQELFPDKLFPDKLFMDKLFQEFLPDKLFQKPLQEESKKMKKEGEVLTGVECDDKKKEENKKDAERLFQDPFEDPLFLKAFEDPSFLKAFEGLLLQKPLQKGEAAGIGTHAARVSDEPSQQDMSKQ